MEFSREEIEKLMTVFDHSGLSEMDLTVKDSCLRLKKQVGSALTTQIPPEKSEGGTKEPAQEEKKLLTAPLAGVFWRSPKPGDKPYIEPGKLVKKGEVVGLIEAMKMMSEVKASSTCVVREILVPDGTYCEYGTPLMHIEER